MARDTSEIRISAERRSMAESIVQTIRAPDGRTLRSDARSNQDLVVRAALEIFEEYGREGTIEQIAQRAGVSRTTVYRSFSTRHALHVAVATSQFQQIHRIALDAQRLSGGRGTGLIDFVFGAFEYNRENRLYLELFDARPTREMRGVHAASRTTIAELTEESKAAGVVRDDASDDDLALLVAALSTRLAADPGATRADWFRAARLVLLSLGVNAGLLPPVRLPQSLSRGL